MRESQRKFLSKADNDKLIKKRKRNSKKKKAANNKIWKKTWKQKSGVKKNKRISPKYILLTFRNQFKKIT